MEISQLYEKAVDKVTAANDVCNNAGIPLCSVTLINTVDDNVYTGMNWKRMNDSFEEEMTCSEKEAVIQMLLDGQSSIESIVTLDPKTMLPITPCQRCLELILKIDHTNRACKILTGKNSQAIITSLNSEIATFAEQFFVEENAKEFQSAVIKETPVIQNNTEPKAEVKEAPNAPEENSNNTNKPEEKPILEGSTIHSAIDTSGLKMIWDDWESNDSNESKPFNANSLSSQQDVINTVQNAASEQSSNTNTNNTSSPYQPMNNGAYPQQPMNGMYQQQPMNGMYQQPMNGMYQQPMNGMYQQQPMNGMYQQQSMGNGMYQQHPMGNGMYQQQPMGNGMYQQQQPMSGMYQQQQPMSGMYQQQQPMSGMYQQQQPMSGMYQQQQKQSNTGSIYLNQARSQQSVPYGAMQSGNASKNMPRAIQSTSVYGTNINDSDNNAIFKDRLNDILRSSSGSKDDDSVHDVMQSAKDKKNAAKQNAKMKKK